MKRLLQLGFLLGLAGTLAGAYFAPWFEYARYRSAASVVANGGRIEQFIVHLPADRIASQASLSSENGEATLEHFKMRDANGNVIGIAARHELATAEGDETAWLLAIPSRGTIALAATAPRTQSIESTIAASGLAPGQSPDQPLSIDLDTPASSVAVTGEFDELDIELVETWVIAGVEDDGRIRGTLVLNTVGRQST